MKVLQLNVWGGKLGAQITTLLQRENADIVCLQEAIRFEGGRSFLFEDVDSIAVLAGYSYVFFTPHIGYPLMKRTAQMGLAILSKQPFMSTVALPLRLAYSDNFDLLDSDYNVQTLQQVQVEIGGMTYNILNYHGYHIREHKNGSAETLRQCEQIASYISTLHEPTILCGDFNLISNSASISIIEKLLQNHTAQAHAVSTRTHLTDKTEACDYIFSSNNFSSYTFTILDDVVSDHKALTLEI
jgi:endonuclease/exonuclease/phosphatase family metal-dependent hydrolase